MANWPLLGFKVRQNWAKSARGGGDIPDRNIPEYSGIAISGISGIFRNIRNTGGVLASTFAFFTMIILINVAMSCELLAQYLMPLLGRVHFGLIFHLFILPKGENVQI